MTLDVKMGYEIASPPSPGFGDSPLASHTSTTALYSYYLDVSA
jgi:hypothetical protein